MNVALILAGGMDPRFQMNIPKQFVNVYNRPIIVYTMEAFQKHEEIDAIAVACLDGWHEMVRAYAKQFNISKLKWILAGGENGQSSGRNGVLGLKEACRQDDIVVIHDAIRPFVSGEIIADSLRVCRQHGMGIAAVRTMDTIMKTQDGKTGRESIYRDSIVRIQTPQAYRVDKLLEIYEKAESMGIQGEVDTNSVASKTGETIYFSKGSDLNLKINTVQDVEMFKALYQLKKMEVKENEE